MKLALPFKPPPPQTTNFMGMGVFQQKNQKMPGGPQNCGRKNYGHDAFSDKRTGGSKA